jgi:hypothetical protein
MTRNELGVKKRLEARLEAWSSIIHFDKTGPKCEGGRAGEKEIDSQETDFVVLV